jgi:mannonate dehydratase
VYPSFRWFGKEDPISLEYIGQIPGVKDVVGSLFELPVGEIWSVAAIKELKNGVEVAGLNLSVIESIPIHEDIKLGKNTRDKWIDNYCESIRHMGKAGIPVLCYNFMPVFDWVRTDLEHPLEDGATPEAE